MTLLDLPSELLSDVTSYLSPWDIASLWFCGTSSLNWKMSVGGGVTRFSFSQDPLFPVCWPRLVRHFPQLVAFDYKEGMYSGNYPPVSLELASVPRKVRRMKLQLDGDLAALLALLDASPAAFPCLEHLFVCDYFAPLATSFPAQLAQLPNLRSLTMWPKWSVTGTQPPLFVAQLPPLLASLQGRFRRLELDACAFPDTLTKLHLQLETSVDFFAALPRALQTLTLSLETETPPVASYDWDKLPADLQALTVDISQQMTQQLVDKLPRTLTKFSRTAGVSPEMEEVINLLPHLPTTLTSLEGFLPDPVPKELFRLLPPHVTYFDESIVHSAIDLVLPAATRLRLQHSDHAIPDGFHAFPPGLTHLSIERINVAIAKKMPFSLKHLSLDTPELSVEETLALPRHITSMVFMRNIPFQSEQCFEALPPTLTLLDALPINIHRMDVVPFLAISPAYEPPSNAHVPEPNAIPRLPQSFSSYHLPKTLRTFTMGPIETEDEEWFAHLPPSLVSLKLAIRHISTRSIENIARACPALRSLDLRLAQYVVGKSGEKREDVKGGDARTGEKARKEEGEGEEKREETPPLDPSEHWIAKAPRRLAAITMSYISTSFDTDVTDEVIKKLPKGLTSLDIPPSPKVTSASAGHLPKYLRRLYFGFNTPSWFEKPQR